MPLEDWAVCRLQHQLPLSVRRGIDDPSADTEPHLRRPPERPGVLRSACLRVGDLETAKSLALRNVEAFDRRTSNRSWSLRLVFLFSEEGYLKLFPNDERVRAFSRKIVEPSTFFLKQMDRSPIGNAPQDEHQKIRLTYHDPCHMKRGMKIYQEPRRLLQASQEIEWVEMKQPNRCCGMAGSFNFVYYDLSRKILNRKSMILRRPVLIAWQPVAWDV